MIPGNKEIKPNILSEQFIPDFAFVYVAKGTIHCFDVTKTYTFKTGEFILAQKNKLARYKITGEFEYRLFCFDEPFLKNFQKKHNTAQSENSSKETFIKIENAKLLKAFIESLKPYSTNQNEIDIAFEDLKYEELLIILLKIKPELSGLVFNYAKPDKVNLGKFMLANFKFNVSLQRFAFLTGRSLSSFKRDFRAIFNDAPSHWLIQKRLEEAYYLIDKKDQKPSDIYLDVGFEDLSHFSFAFKKLFGLTPTELNEKKTYI